MKYGVTPWGEKFIGALSKFDMSGRLSRGKTYANKGSVTSLEIDKNSINAKVSGSYSNYYNISVSFIPFNKSDQEKIFTIIEENPLILADILNRKLPDQLNDLLNDEGIALLPRSWRDITRSCSCPDWGDPCKHMAAVYYVLTAEIDKNPFTIFEIRGVDLISRFSIKSSNLKISSPLNIIYSEKSSSVSRSDIELVSFSSYSPFITSLLGDHPPFAEINYSTVMEEFYKKSSRSLGKQIYPYNREDLPLIERVMKEADITIDIGEKIIGAQFKIETPLFQDDPALYNLFSEMTVNKTENGMEMPVLEMAKFFISFESDSGSAEYRFLYYTFRVLYLLIESSGFVPAVHPVDGEYHIVYKALLSIPEIRHQIEKLSETAPPMVTYKGSALNQTSSVETLFTLLFTTYVHELNFMHKARKNNPPQISEAFFKKESAIDDSSFATKETPQSVAAWLSVFDLVRSEYRFSVYIEKEKEYTLGVTIMKDETEYELSEAILKFDTIELLKFLSFLRIYLPEVALLLKRSRVTTSQARLEEFILNTVFTLSNLGVTVVLPKELRNILNPKPVVTAKSSAKGYNSYLSLDKLLDYKWMIAIGDKMISLEEFERLVEKGHELIEFNNQFVRISPEDAKRIFADLKKKETLSAFDIIKANLQDELVADEQTRRFLGKISETDETIEVPDALQATLREYQERGFKWAVNNLKNGFGVILADDMGLGKTIQTIAILLHMKKEKILSAGTVIVAPTTLLSNWGKELDKFAPSLSYSIYHGSDRSFDSDSDILITTYNLIMRDETLFKKETIDCIIIDEAQAIKNPDTKTTKAVKRLKAKYKIALSGTPVENNLSELWSIFDFTIPKYLKTLKQFKTEFAKDIEIRKEIRKIEILKKITSPFMLRRLKTDKKVISDLPDKIVIDEFAPLSKEQAALYQSVVDSSLEKIRSLDGIERKGLVFKLLTSLKQICNHPRNFDKSSAFEAELSGKTALLLTLLENIIAKQEKVLIFTQYTEMMAILIEIIEKRLHTVPLSLKGSMNRKQREEAVDLFQNSDKHNIFILSLKAAGTGLNLTAASNVIHYDLWYNPAVENQATDRAFRIGQKKNVFVHRFITKNSFEEKIDRMIKMKQELSDLSVNIGEKWLTEMDDEEICELFS